MHNVVHVCNGVCDVIVANVANIVDVVDVGNVVVVN